MKSFARWSIALTLLGGCTREDPASSLPSPLRLPIPVRPTERPTATDELRRERLGPEATRPGAGAEPSWVPSLKRVCEEVGKPDKDPNEKKKIATDGWETYKDKLGVTVRDFRLYVPELPKWSLLKVDADNKTAAVRHRGPFYGFGATVEVENKGDAPIEGETVMLWLTYSAKGGEKYCYAFANAARSWNPFADKGKGAWSVEKNLEEWPLRPKEKKRYTVTRSDCPFESAAEAGIEKVTAEVFLRFHTLADDEHAGRRFARWERRSDVNMPREPVIAGPLVTLERGGDLLRGVPVADAARAQQATTGAKGALEPANVLVAMGDHLYVASDKKGTWLPLDQFPQIAPWQPITAAPVEDAPAAYKQAFGSLTLSIDGWKLSGWRELNGALKPGQKRISANVSIAIDASSVEKSLADAYNAAKTAADASAKAAADKAAAATAAKDAATAAKGQPDEAAKKDAQKQADADAKTAGAADKAAQKALKDAEKAKTGGMAAFLKTQAKAVDCGSFKIDLGGKSAKLAKGAMGGKECKALEAGQAVKGTILFDLDRWDAPLVLAWGGPDKKMQHHVLVSRLLGKLLAE